LLKVESTDLPSGRKNPSHLLENTVRGATGIRSIPSPHENGALGVPG